ncbi:hypothetical protein [Idiomarina sp.]|uniref:hypothetical protein n=1 Tax=Idiomarina sp. TaxID=1874361 RepID=UPI0025BD80AC|nr:hypothetical protein [Idiomarina sp.]NQZ04241.1 hypothetical protein [Idiomarina sp.]
MFLNKLIDLPPIQRWRTYREIQKHRAANRFQAKEVINTSETLDLPESEKPRLAGIWVVELYPPSHTSKLRDSIKSIGWDEDTIGKKKLAQWLDDTRYGRSAGWINLGPVTNPQNISDFSLRSATLPDNTNCAYPYLVSITPSLTALITLFILNESDSEDISLTIRREYQKKQTEVVKKNTVTMLRYLLLGNAKFFARKTRYPNQIREETVKQVIARHTETCVSWISERFPGVFSSSSKTGDFPTACLVLTEEITPFTEQARKILKLRGLRLSEPFGGWQVAEHPSLNFYTPSSFDSEGKRLTFSGKRSEVLDDSDSQQQTCNHSIATSLQGEILPIISEWATSALLDKYCEDLSGMRDDAANIGKFNPLQDLRRLRALSHTTLYDISMCVKELPERSDFASGFDPVTAKSIKNELHKERDFKLEARKFQRERSDQLKHQTETLTQVLSQTGHISQTISNLRTQRLVVLLTSISILVSALALLITS